MLNVVVDFYDMDHNYTRSDSFETGVTYAEAIRLWIDSYATDIEMYAVVRINKDEECQDEILDFAWSQKLGVWIEL